MLVQRNLPDSDEGFQTVTRNQKKKRRIGFRSANSPFSGLMKKAVVCVNRLDRNISTETVSNFLQENGIVVHSCFEVNGSKSSATLTGSRESTAPDSGVLIKPRNYIMMRICVPQSDLSKIMSEHLWLEGVTVRPWSFKAKSAQ